MDALGDFVITWTSTGNSAPGIYGQLYTAAGLVSLGEFRVNTTPGIQASSAVAFNPVLGDFVVTWASYNQTPGSGWDIYARRYNLLGLPYGSEFRVNTTTAGDQTAPSVAISRFSGDFAISWTSAGQDGDGLGIYAQRYDRTGSPERGEFQVNTTTDGDQTDSSVAIDSNGNIFVAWASYGQDGSGWGVYGQVFAAVDGLKVDGETPLTIANTGDQQSPSLAISTLGQAILVWSGNGPGDANGVFFDRIDLTKDAFDPPSTPAHQPKSQNPWWEHLRFDPRLSNWFDFLDTMYSYGAQNDAVGGPNEVSPHYAISNNSNHSSRLHGFTQDQDRDDKGSNILDDLFASTDFTQTWF